MYIISLLQFKRQFSSQQSKKIVIIQLFEAVPKLHVGEVPFPCAVLGKPLPWPFPNGAVEAVCNAVSAGVWGGFWGLAGGRYGIHLPFCFNQAGKKRKKMVLEQVLLSL
jgi:hypothetical protein